MRQAPPYFPLLFFLLAAILALFFLAEATGTRRSETIEKARILPLSGWSAPSDGKVFFTF